LLNGGTTFLLFESTPMYPMPVGTGTRSSDTRLRNFTAPAPFDP
jgi:hypothetical protein